MRKWDLESLKVDALRFNTPTEWARGSSGAYSAASVMGVLDECCGHMQRKTKPWSKETAIADAANYKTKIEWKNKSNSAYAAAHKNGWIDEACAHMTSLRRKMDKATVLTSAAQYQTRGAWDKGDGVAYAIALRKGWLDEACAHMSLLRETPTKDMVLASASQYQNKTAWKIADPAKHAAAKRHGWFEEACAHMNEVVRQPWTKAEVTIAALGFQNPTAFKDGCSGAWSVAQRDGYLEEVCSHMVRLAHKPSDQEQALFDYVLSLCPDAVQSDNSVLGLKQLDILIPSKMLAIEFNGLFWHSSRTGRSRSYHQDKTDAAAKAGYRLIHIWSDEWIEKQDIIKAYLRMQLVGPDRVIGARQCSIVAIPPEVALPFHRMFHLQGGRGGEHYGLYLAGELLAVATVQGCELARWTVRFGTVVVGALSKMMKHIGRRIISYCDTAKHTGAGYIAAGFKQIGVAAPSYYYTEGNKRFNRVGFQKHKLLGKPGAVGETEAELAASLGFYQVGGCRQLKFEFNKA